MDWYFAIGLARDDRRSAAISYRVANVIAVVTAISQKHVGLRQIIIDLSIKALEV